MYGKEEAPKNIDETVIDYGNMGAEECGLSRR